MSPDLGGEDADGVDRILGAGRHLLALINELIDIARIESGDLSLSLEPVLVRPVIEEISQLMARSPPSGASPSLRTASIWPLRSAPTDSGCPRSWST